MRRKITCLKTLLRHELMQIKSPARVLLGVHQVRQVSVIRAMLQKRGAQQTAPVRIMNVTGIVKN